MSMLNGLNGTNGLNVVATAKRRIVGKDVARLDSTDISQAIRLTTVPDGSWVGWVVITPDLAKKLIAKNKKNRSVSDKYVAQVARDIVAGRWTPDGSPVRVSKKGVLLDGQHRCHAVLKSGKPILALLVTGLDDKAMNTIDGGRKRTHGDRLAIRGDSHSRRRAAAAKFIIELERAELTSNVGGYSFADIEDAIERHSAGIEWAMHAIPGRIEPGIPSGGAAIYGAFSFLYPVSTSRIEKMAHRFVTGEGLLKKDPMKALRTVVMGQKQETKYHYACRVLRCIEAGLKGSGLSVSRVDSEVVNRVLKMRTEVAG